MSILLVVLQPVSTDHACLGQDYSGPRSSWVWLGDPLQEPVMGGKAVAVKAGARGEGRSKLSPGQEVYLSQQGSGEAQRDT